MRPMPSPQEIADRYAAGMANAVPRYKAGISRVTESPMAKAAARLDKAKQNYIAAIDSGKTAAALNRVTNQYWQQMSSTKGANNLVTGANAAKPKVANSNAAMRPQVDALRAEIYAMPDNTPAERDARQLAWSNGMRAIAAQRNR